MTALRSPVRSGFTLVELLVAIVILTLIVIIIGQLVGTTSAITTMNNKHMDANSQARSVFDRMADDFARMIKRSDVDCIFYKSPTSGPTSGNDVMFFFTEGASYFDNTLFSPPSGGTNNSERNPVSLVGYRVNNISGNFSYCQFERLGKVLSWDATSSNAPVVYLTYPPAGTDVVSIDPTGYPYSTAFFGTTLFGAYSNSAYAPSVVGTQQNYFNDGTDSYSPGSSPYHILGSQVFRFEYSFQLKDGTNSAISVMTAATSSNPNGIPYSKVDASQRPLPTDDSANGNGDGTFKVGSRWYDTTNQIGYICIDATPNYAVWHEIGIQDIAAIVVTIAIIDKQGGIFVQNHGIDKAKLAAQLPDYVSGNDPADLLKSSNSSSWTAKLLPSGSTASPFATATNLPQSMVSQIRVFQRTFYINKQ